MFSRPGELFAAPLVMWLEEDVLAGLQQRMHTHEGGWKEYMVDAPGALGSVVERALRCVWIVLLLFF